MSTVALKSKSRWVSAASTNKNTTTTATAAEVRKARVHPEHRLRINDRNRRRRYPWHAAATTVATGSFAWAMTSLFATANVDALPVAATTAGLPLAIGFACAWRAQNHSAWIPDIAAGTLASAAITFWAGMTGPTWWHAVALLLATVLVGHRWWAANPVGPGVAPLWEPEPEAQPEPATPTVTVEKNPVDDIVAAWNQFVAGPNGKAKGSRLSNREIGDVATSYLVELQRGQQNYKSLNANAVDIAGGLGLDREQVFFERGPRGWGTNWAKMTIVQGDPLGEDRYWAGPETDDGIIKNVGRYSDGIGSVDISRWTDQFGCVPTMIVGGTGSGKSGAANVITAGALSDGLLNLCYIDPKGNSSSAIRDRARIAIVGKDNAKKAAELVEEIRAARGNLGHDMLFPSAEFPGWMVLHDEFSLIVDDSKVRARWCETVNTVRALGIWPVAVNQVMHVVKWGDEQTRGAFASQVIALRTNSTSDDLIPGLEFRPSELPAHEDGTPIAGSAVRANAGRANIPLRFDRLPSDHDRVRDADGELIEPPLRTSEAFDRFFNQPEPHDIDRQVIESILGPAVDGRWVVGGPNATHHFPVPVEDDEAAPKGATRKSTGGFGLNKAKKDNKQPKVTVNDKIVELIEGGTTATSAIHEALPSYGESTINNGLTELVGDQRIHRAAKGQYGIGPSPESA